MTVHAVTAALAGAGTVVADALVKLPATNASVSINDLTSAVFAAPQLIETRTFNVNVAPNDLTPGVIDQAQGVYSANAAMAAIEQTAGVIDREALQRSFDTIGVASAGLNLTSYFKKRARDSACGSPTYVTWVTTNVNTPYPGALPCGGPLVEEVIAEFWQI